MEEGSVTSQALDSFQAFPEEYDVLIGKVVRAFGVLERELAIPTLHSAKRVYAEALEAGDVSAAKSIKSELNQPAASQLKYIEALSGFASLSEQQQDLRELVVEVKGLLKHRNLICHGVWFPADGAVTAILWSREAVTMEATLKQCQRVIPDRETYAPDDLSELAERALICARIISVLDRAISEAGRRRWPTLFPTPPASAG